MPDDNTSQQPDDRQQPFDEILANLMRAIDAGEELDQDEWITRHAEFAAEIAEFFQQHAQIEKLVHPLRQAATHALHVRCPHCHNPIELVEEAALTDISCPSCGSSFSLVGEKTVSHYPAGEKNIGHFQLLDRVGIGAFGSVWKAKDTKLDRIVAVKIPRNGQLNESQTELFLRDARAAAQLKHANIVSVHEVGKQDGSLYIVSDFIHGATLKEWLDAKHLTPRESAELCVKICKALHHAHEAGVIHRDLKPGNIMMDTDGEPHIVDFGLAKRDAGEITMTVEGQILGTPAYMPPEQARGEGHSVDRRADIYSLGVILFELLTGELPFRGDKQMLIVQILKDEPPSPRKLNSGIPRDLETICLKCLAKESGKRYATTRELSADLGRWLSGNAILARRSGAAERVVKWARRNPAAAGLVSVICLASISLIAGLAISNSIVRRALYDRTAALGEKTEALAERDDAMAELQESLDRERKVTYAQLIAVAWREWRDGRLQECDEYLDDCERSLRGWEWHYLKRLCDGAEPLTSVTNLRRPGEFAIFCDDRKRLAIADGASLHLLDIRSGKTDTREFPAARRFDKFAINGRWLAAAGAWTGEESKDAHRHKTIQVFDIASQSEHLNIPVRSRDRQPITFPAITVSDDGNRLVVHIMHGRNRQMQTSELKVWDVENGKEVLSLSDGRSRFTTSPDGRVVASWTNDEVSLWDTKTGELSQTYRIAADQIAFSRDGNVVIIADDDGHLRCWNTDDTNPRTVIKHHGTSVHHLVVSSDGQRCAVMSGIGTLIVWDTISGREMFAARGNQLELNDAIFFSADGRRLARKGRTQLRVWHVESGTEECLLRTRDYIRAASFDEKEDRLILCEHDDIRPRGGQNVYGYKITSWSLGDDQESRTLIQQDQPKGFWTAAVSPDNAMVATVFHSTMIKVVEVATGKVTLTIDGDEKHIFDVAFNPQSNQLATAGYEGVKIWDSASGQLIHKLMPDGKPYCTRVSFARDGQRVVFAHRQGVTWWDLKTGESRDGLRDMKTSWFSSAIFDKSGTRVVASGQLTGVLVLNTKEGSVNQLTTDKIPHTVFTATLSPDQQRIAAAGDGAIVVWDVKSNTKVLVLKGHESGVHSVAYNSAGTRLVSAGKDGTIRIWDPSIGRELLKLEGHATDVFTACFSANDSFIVSAGGDGTTRIWNAAQKGTMQ